MDRKAWNAAVHGATKSRIQLSDWTELNEGWQKYSGGRGLLFFSCSVTSHSLRPHGLLHARLSCPSLSLGVCSNLCPLNWWHHPSISSSVIPFFSCLHPFKHEGLFQWVSSSHKVAKILEFQLQHQSFQWIFELISFRIYWLDLLAVQETLKRSMLHDKVEIILCVI